MWFWNGERWQFMSLASPFLLCAAAMMPRVSLPGEPKPQKPPVEIGEYVARIREHCD